MMKIGERIHNTTTVFRLLLLLLLLSVVMVVVSLAAPKHEMETGRASSEDIERANRT